MHAAFRAGRLAGVSYLCGACYNASETLLAGLRLLPVPLFHTDQMPQAEQESPTMQTTCYLMDSVRLPDGWADRVLVQVDRNGIIRSVEPDSGVRPDHVISGAVVPGMPNCHSHAHQRAMSGAGERAGIDPASGRRMQDSFWTWRSAMYRNLRRIQPDDLYAIARMVYLEMLKSGYTHVAEFQYLHHGPDGQPYANPATMTLRCMEAARHAGIGFTALPVLYRYGGFGQQAPLEGQRRFITDVDGFSEIVCRLQQEAGTDAGQCATVGIAPHSLRAVSDPLLNAVIENLSGQPPAVIHIHIAEQEREVDDCREWSGERPVEWLLNRFDVGRNWCLVHATHMDESETRRLAQSGAVAGLCPTTEANLGDGFFNLEQYSQAGGSWAIGSDSHISISPVEELRWLEYGHRLLNRHRNIMATDAEPSTGAALLEQALQGGRSSCGLRIGSVAPGYRADFVVLDTDHPRLYGCTGDQRVDNWIFSGNECLVKDVYTSGRRVICDGCHIDEEGICQNYRNVLDRLNRT